MMTMMMTTTTATMTTTTTTTTTDDDDDDDDDNGQRRLTISSIELEHRDERLQNFSAVEIAAYNSKRHSKRLVQPSFHCKLAICHITSSSSDSITALQFSHVISRLIQTKGWMKFTQSELLIYCAVQ